jgi:hypothetical protein
VTLPVWFSILTPVVLVIGAAGGGVLTGGRTRRDTRPAADVTVEAADPLLIPGDVLTFPAPSGGGDLHTETDCR